MRAKPKKKSRTKKISEQESKIFLEEKRLRQFLRCLDSSSTMELSLVTQILNDNWQVQIERSSKIHRREKRTGFNIRNNHSTGSLKEVTKMSISPFDPDFPYTVAPFRQCHHLFG